MVMVFSFGCFLNMCFLLVVNVFIYILKMVSIEVISKCVLMYLLFLLSGLVDIVILFMCFCDIGDWFRLGYYIRVDYFKWLCCRCFRDVGVRIFKFV